MSGYIGNIPTPQATQSRQSFIATASQTTFATVGYTAGFLDVYLNGVHLLDGTDYTATNGSDIVLTTGAALDDVVEFVAYETFSVSDQSFTGTTTTGSLTTTGPFTSLGIDDNATATAMTLDASGNVLVGATSKVSNGSGAVVKGSTGAEGAVLEVFCEGNAGANRDAIRFYNGSSAEIGSIQYNSTSVSFLTSSDYRLKENITPIQGAGDIVKAMRPVTYNFKSDGIWNDGFLAHELQELHPYAVSGEKDAVDEHGEDKYQRVDYSKITPILTAALQEALNKIDALEARLTSLETTT